MTIRPSDSSAKHIPLTSVTFRAVIACHQLANTCSPNINCHHFEPEVVPLKLNQANIVVSDLHVLLGGIRSSFPC